MQVQAIPFKEAAIYEHDPETQPSFVGKSSFKMEINWNFKFVLEISLHLC